MELTGGLEISTNQGYKSTELQRPPAPIEAQKGDFPTTSVYLVTFLKPPELQK